MVYNRQNKKNDSPIYPINKLNIDKDNISSFYDSIIGLKKMVKCNGSNETIFRLRKKFGSVLLTSHLEGTIPRNLPSYPIILTLLSEKNILYIEKFFKYFYAGAELDIIDFLDSDCLLKNEIRYLIIDNINNNESWSNNYFNLKYVNKLVESFCPHLKKKNNFNFSDKILNENNDFFLDIY